MRKVELLPTRDCEAGYGPAPGGYQVIIILPIKSKMAAAKKRCLLRFLGFTESSSPPSFKVRGLQMTTNLALV